MTYFRLLHPCEFFYAATGPAETRRTFPAGTVLVYDENIPAWTGMYRVWKHPGWWRWDASYAGLRRMSPLEVLAEV